MKKLLLAIFVASCALMAQPTVTISDTWYSRANGQLTASWPAFTLDSVAVAAGSRSVSITQGVFSIALWPSDRAISAGVVGFVYTVSAGGTSDSWSIPFASAGRAVGLNSVHALTPPSSGSVPASSVTAGTFGAGNYVFPGNVAIGTADLKVIHALSTPAAPSISQTGTAGSNTYGWKVVAFSAVGGTLASAEATSTVGNVLDGTHYYTVTTAAITGSDHCEIERSSDSTDNYGTGIIASISCGSSYQDQGASPTKTSPISNLSGGLYSAQNLHMLGHAAIGNTSVVDGPNTATGYLPIVLSIAEEFSYATPNRTATALYELVNVNNANISNAFLNDLEIDVTSMSDDSNVSGNGFLVFVKNGATNSFAQIQAAAYGVANFGAGNIALVEGLNLSVYHAGAGTIAQDNIIHIVGSQGAGTVTAYNGLLIDDPTVGGCLTCLTNINSKGATSLNIFEGTMEIDTLKTTGAATGKKLVCVDTATGKLYASSSGVAGCLN